MVADIKIGLLCNNKMAFPAMQRMITEGVLCSIATSDKDTEVVTLFSQKAQECNVPYYNIKHKNYKEQLVQWLQDTQADVVFVITFPWRIPASVFSMPRLGFLNVHFGLLPQMRGADPIFESIRQCKKTAGATVHVMDEGLDTGPVVVREEITITAEATYGMLSTQMAYLGDKMCAAVINDLKAEKKIEAIPQDEQQAQYWPRISAEELTIRWDEMDSLTIKALVKSCNPIAKGVPVILNGWKIGITDISEVNLQGDSSAIVPGTIIAIDPQNGLLVCCKDGKAMKLDVVYTEEGFFPGYKLAFFGITVGMVLTSHLQLISSLT
ncbi:MAG: hypothetical protein JWQ38_2962 [Flavipsychrobacter sp.]|nr:hypothetical protein [Flavipsychrobacter sp.]